ncbi:MAG: hypothetical protein AMJ54_12690 [Deltaproteobacteria bacterium SG8_13]|nr:MAG: hypothetical protein AMJ54_12690 [Deltaproteobacteria bacterium SG8_13]
MTRKKGKAISFDAMVKFFMQHYDIPTKKDVDRVVDKLDRLEKMLKASGGGGRRRTIPRQSAAGSKTRGRGGDTAMQQVLQVVEGLKQGAGFADIKAKTGFDDKKIRNVIYRLTKLQQIKRKSRGVYVAK